MTNLTRAEGTHPDPVHESGGSNTAVRERLERNPVAVECARAAAAFSGSPTEVVVFGHDRAFIVASTDVTTMMQPRSLTDAERKLVRGQDGIVSEPDGLSVPVHDRDGALVAALSVLGDGSACPRDALLALARLIAAEVQTGSETDDDRFFHNLVEGLRDAVILLSTDLRIMWVNSAVCSLLGLTPAEVLGQSAADYLHPDDIEVTLDAFVRLGEGLETFRRTVRVRNSSGRYIPIEATGMDHREDPLLRGIVVCLRDAQYESELGVSVERTRSTSAAIVGGMRDGVVATDQQGAVTLVNAVARQMFGIDASVPPAALTLHDFPVVDLAGIPRTLTNLGSEHNEPVNVSCVVSETGDVRYVNTTSRAISDSTGEPMSLVVVFHDVTAARQAAEELRHQALHDYLTGLANRRHLDQRLTNLASLAIPTTVAACFIDLDGFKLVNDTRGHRTGDELIRLAGTRLGAAVRDSDLLVRLGGGDSCSFSSG